MEINKIRIFHGPENIGGIGRRISDWQRANKKVVSDFIVFEDNTVFQNSHNNLDLKKYNFVNRVFKKFKFFFDAIKKYDLFQFYFGKTLLPFSVDLPILRLLGKKILMNYVGSDIRLFTVTSKINSFYKMNKPKYQLIILDFLRIARMFWQGLWVHYCFAELELYAYASICIPKKKINRDLLICKALDIPATQPRIPQNPIPVIIHAPTNIYIKGTQFIELAINELIEEGLSFDFYILQNLKHEELINKIHHADILIDQIYVGSFGILATEGMVHGKPVCCFVMPFVRQELPDLPIVQCTVDTIKEQLRHLILDKEDRERIGQESWAFARKHFDRDTIYEQLWQIYLELMGR